VRQHHILGVGDAPLLLFVLLQVLVPWFRGRGPYKRPVYTWLISRWVYSSTSSFLVDQLSPLYDGGGDFRIPDGASYTSGYMADDDGYQRFFSYSRCLPSRADSCKWRIISCNIFALGPERGLVG